MAPPRVAVIIVNYNGRDFLQRLLPTLSATAYPRFEVHVVDNASTDGSVDWLRRARPRVHLLARATNDGLSRAVNEGVGRTTADAFVLLNPDVVVPAAWLATLVKAAYERETIGIAAAVPLHADEWDSTYRPPPDLPSTVPVSKVSGAAMLIKRSTWERLGPMDEEMFLYWEDTDYCWRAVLRGLEVVYVPAAFVLHDHGGTVRRSRERDRIEYEKAKNELYVHAKLLGGWRVRSRILWFRLRGWLRPRKNRHLRSAVAWCLEHHEAIRRARARDLGPDGTVRAADLRRLRRADRRLDRAMARHWRRTAPSPPQ